jgi:hemerythrin-like domain-containing protein
MLMREAGQRLTNDHEDLADVTKQLLTALHNRDVPASYRKLDLLWARLAVHIRAEHLHLFPVVASRISEARTTIEILRADHNFFMQELAQAINILREHPNTAERAGSEPGLSSVIDAVLEVEKRLAIHNEVEEDQIYSLTETTLTEPEQIELAARINAELETRPPRFSPEAWAN